MKVMSLKSSAGLQGPLFTWFLSQQGALPLPIYEFSYDDLFTNNITLASPILLKEKRRFLFYILYLFHDQLIYTYIAIYICILK